MATKQWNFKIKSIDQGYCRILYETRNSSDEKIYYCLQEDYNDQPVNLYRCTQQPWCEPDYIVTIKKDAVLEFEIPTGDTQLENKVKEWIKEHGYGKGNLNSRI